jgi:hypothetical protein
VQQIAMKGATEFRLLVGAQAELVDYNSPIDDEDLLMASPLLEV